VEAATADEVVELVRGCDARDEPVLVLGGGSNVVVADAGLDATVVRITSRGMDVAAHPDDPGRVLLTVAAGEPWDDVVARAVGEGWSGLECLSGIPGLTGATPIQNVGAYGQEVAETLHRVRVYDRVTCEVAEMAPEECGFTYRHSVFKSTDRYVVLAVSYGLPRDPLSRPVRYAEVARTLGIEPGGRVPLAAAREAVLGLRRGKGMVLDPTDADTRSVGSFFTNPVLDVDGFAALQRRVTEHLGPDAVLPRFPAEPGRVKTSAAWLIERSGFAKGYGAGPARISTKHTLALTNRGEAKADDVLALAREVRDGVRATFGVTLVNEPVLVGLVL
ncbi:MAG: UDP-N-acetylmuramate dehydrogenase, partial [Actinomycetes bacterium]